MSVDDSAEITPPVLLLLTYNYVDVYSRSLLSLPLRKRCICGIIGSSGQHLPVRVFAEAHSERTTAIPWYACVNES